MDDKLTVGVINSIEYMRNLTMPTNPDRMFIMPDKYVVYKKLSDYSNEELLAELKVRMDNCVTK